MTQLFRTFLLFIITASVCAPHVLCANETQRNELQVRAAIVYNIAKYVTWPVLDGPDSTLFTIGVVGQNRSMPAWKNLHNKTVHGRNIRIRRIIDLDDLAECQLIYIEASEKKNIPRILAAVREYPVLTVSDVDGFANSGGMVTLHIVNNRLAFAINLRSASSSGLIISSNILKLATEVLK